MFKHMGILASYSELIGHKKSKQEIKELVNQMPLLSSYISLSQLSTEVYDEKEFRNYFREMCLNFINEGFKNEPPPNIVSNQVYEALLQKLDSLKNTVVFSSQSILNIWKWLLAYGNKEKLDQLQEARLNIPSLCYLSLMTNDYLFTFNNDIEKIYAELFSNLVFNHHTSVNNDISRTFLIYSQIAQDKSLFNNDFLDINNDFHNKYGYTIKQYLAVVFGLIASFLKPNVLGANWIKDIDEIYSISNLKDIAKEIISSLTIDINSISTWSKNEIDSFWNFQKFREKPLLMVNDKQFLPFSLRLLEDQLFSGLFHKVRHVYPKENKDFLAFYGKPFEKYTQLLLSESLKQTSLPYEIVPEFRYRKTKDSPDIMLRLGNKLLAIEVKSYRLLLPSIIEANLDTINSDTNKMIIKPLKQVHNRVQELMEDQHKSVKGVDEIYFIVVTQGHYPTFKPYEEKIDQELKASFKLPVRGYYHLDIEEFEMLCHLIERKRPIFKVLNNKNKLQNKYSSFKTFLIDNKYHVRKNKLLDSQFDSAIEEINSILFGEKHLN